MHLFSMAIVNAFIIFRQVGGNGCLLDFHTEICRTLLGVEDVPDSDIDEEPVTQVRSLRASDVPKQICEDRINH